MFKKPPLEITACILNTVQDISLLLGRYSDNFQIHSNIRLRKANNIRTIKSTVSIEGNTMSLDQVTDVLNGERIIAPEREIREVKNAIAVYERFNEFDAFCLDDLLKAHGIMMKGLTEGAGDFRSTGVCIMKDRQCIHVAPPAIEVSGLIANVFSYLQESEDSLLVKSCVFHYELEFIHPFSDGNGRMGRLWQQLILTKLHPIFKLVCVEELLEKFQSEYYAALQRSDQKGSSEDFVEFMLGIIKEALKQLKLEPNIENNGKSRLNYARSFLTTFKRSDYMNIFPQISTATASRDLASGVKSGILRKSQSNNQTMYVFAEGDLIRGKNANEFARF